MGRSIEPQAIRSLKILIAVALLLPLPLFCYAGWKSYSGLVRAADERTGHTIDVLQEHALKVLQTAERSISETNEILRGLSDAEIAARERELHDQLRSIGSALPDVEAITVFAADGSPLVSGATYPVNPDQSNADRAYFKAHASESRTRPFISEVVQSRMRSMNVFVISEARPRVHGQFNGIVTVSVLPSNINAFYAKVAGGTGMTANLVREDGVVLARYPEQDDPARRLGPGSAFAAGISREDEGRYSTVSPIDGVERNVRYRKLPNYPVYVASGFETRVIWHDLLRQMADYLWFGLPLMVLLAVVSRLAILRTRDFQAETGLRETAESALKQAQRLEAIGQMTGGIAHDFNNILLVVQGNAERLQRQITDPKQSRAIAAILQAAALGEKLTRQLLSFSRRQTVAPTEFQLGEQLPHLRQILETSLRGDIVLDIDLPEDLWPVKVDPTEFELGLINLAVNARDAMPNGGRLTVRGRNASLRKVDTPDEIEGDFVALAISDTGTGIPADVLPKIFDPFFTTKEVGRGTGLGLSQVYGFTRQAGGTAIATSADGAGACITLYLPRGEAIAKPDAAQPVPEAQQRKLAGTAILLVEDNPSVAEVTRMHLEDVGCSVSYVATGDDARRAIEGGGGRWDIVLSDIVMPGNTSGIDLARWLRNRPRPLPIVLATGFSRAANEAQDEGFLIIRKPYERAALEAMLVQALSLARR